MGSSVMFTNLFEFSLSIGLEAWGIQLTEASGKKIREGIKEMNASELKHMMYEKLAPDLHY